jgi:hypothetical protein
MTTIVQACAEIDRRADRMTELYVACAELAQEVDELKWQLGRSEDKRYEP